MRKFCALLLSPALAFAATTNSIAPAKVIQLSVPANNAAFVEASRAGVPGLTTLKGIIALPEGFNPAKPWPVMLVTASAGSSAVQAWHQYTNAGLSQGWIIVAVDGPKVTEKQDHNRFAWGMISALLEQLRRSWPASRQWPFACAGFSGGAKRAAMTAANMVQQGDKVIGVFMAGCNEDRATTGYRLAQSSAKFLDVPMFLSNGLEDPIANLQHGAVVKQSMEQTGFRNIRLEAFPGKHQLDARHLEAALQWFRPAPKKSP